MLFSVGTMVAQQSHVVTYDGDANASSKRPHFAGALIAVDFGGPAAERATTLFRHLGARRFNVGHNPCVSPEKVIVCVRIEQGTPIQASGSGQSASYGSHGGFSSGGSFSGQFYPITLRVFLVENEGATYKTVPLGEAMCFASSGSGSEYSSSYGNNGGGSYYSSSSGGLSIDPAVKQDMDMLLLKGSLAHSLDKFLSWGVQGGWIPGADLTVKNAFAH